MNVRGFLILRIAGRLRPLGSYTPSPLLDTPFAPCCLTCPPTFFSPKVSFLGHQLCCLCDLYALSSFGKAQALRSLFGSFPWCRRFSPPADTDPCGAPLLPLSSGGAKGFFAALCSPATRRGFDPVSIPVALSRRLFKYLSFRSS